MNIHIISVGKKHDPKLKDAIAEYEKRLSAYCSLSWTFIVSSDKAKESQSILAVIKPEDVVVLLDERGKLWDNQRLAMYLGEAQNRAIKRLVLVIGGSYGIDPSVVARANALLSLSPLVFPHQLVRLMVVEQLYRTYSILAGGKYHHN